MSAAPYSTMARPTFIGTLPDYNLRANAHHPRPSFPLMPGPLPPSHHHHFATPKSLGSFKPPAHKHAHHLHTIPPREKSTRTLIIDHMLWVHARTRLQQARAELGMNVNMAQDGDENGGNGPLDVSEQPSDGEDPLVLKFRARERQPIQNDDEMQVAQDLNLAHALRLRADGLERTLVAMLDQPPEVQSPYSDEEIPRTPPAIHGAGEHLFPNGVRLRLALSTLVNDLFARDVPTPLASTTANTPSYKARSGSVSSTSGPVTSPLILSRSVFPESHNDKDRDLDCYYTSSNLPISLLPLLEISSFRPSSPQETDVLQAPKPQRPNEQGSSSSSLPGISSFSRPSTSVTDILPPILQKSNSNNAGGQNLSNSPQYTASPPPMGMFAPQQLGANRPTKATGRVTTLYKGGADPNTANSPPSLRCPRHLHHGCQICAPVNPSPVAKIPRQSGSTRAAIILGSGGAKSRSIGGVSSWNTGAGIGAGLAKPGIRGTTLLRRSISHHATSHPTAKDVGLCACGGKLVDLIPRFIRLSALVAVELGREAKDREEEARSRKDDYGSRDEDRMETEDQEKPPPFLPQPVPRFARPRGATESYGDGQGPIPRPGSPSKDNSPSFVFSVSFRPTREWYAILAGLLTRAALEGYLSRGWKGSQGAECLLRVGTGINQVAQAQSPRKRSGSQIGQLFEAANVENDEDEFGHIDPDDCPSLLDAAKILFPSLRGSEYVDEANFDTQFEEEMSERLAEFLSIPPSTPDLSTHLEDLAYKFPAEPVERAAVRFCEAVAQWRGKPELEIYRNLPEFQTRGSKMVNNPSSLPLDPKPQTTIDRYFIFPRKAYSQGAPMSPRMKRPRSPGFDDLGFGMKTASGQSTEWANKRTSAEMLRSLPRPFDSYGS